MGSQGAMCVFKHVICFSDSVPKECIFLNPNLTLLSLLSCLEGSLYIYQCLLY